MGLVYEEDLVKAELAYLACAAGIALDPTTAGMFGVGDWRSAWLRRLNSVRKHFDKLWLVISVRTQGKLITRVRHTSAMHHSLHDIHSCSCRAGYTCVLISIQLKGCFIPALCVVSPSCLTIRVH